MFLRDYKRTELGYLGRYLNVEVDEVGLNGTKLDG